MINDQDYIRVCKIDERKSNRQDQHNEQRRTSRSGIVHHIESIDFADGSSVVFSVEETEGIGYRVEMNYFPRSDR